MKQIGACGSGARWSTTRPPYLRLCPANPGNPRRDIEGESASTGKDIRSGRTCRCADRAARQPPRPLASRGQQVVDIGSDLRWIRIPVALPVAVYLPIWTRKLAIVGSTPLANCVVRSAQAAIRPEMRCPCHGASGRCGTDDLPLLGKRSIKLRPDFQANAPVPIDGDVATGSRLLRTHCIPDQPTALRHDARKLGRAGLSSDDSDGHTIDLVELDCRGRQWFSSATCSFSPEILEPRR